MAPISFTGRYLLTGAGFTNNFGAPLAREVSDRILNRREVSDRPRLRRALQAGFDFEEVYQKVMWGEEADGYDETDRRVLSAAVEVVFRDFDQHCNVLFGTSEGNESLNFHNLIAQFAQPGRVGLLFTLNQDLFLEKAFSSLPEESLHLRHLGVERRGWPPYFDQGLQSRRPAAGRVRLHDDSQLRQITAQWNQSAGFYYLKLHGSYDWESARHPSNPAHGCMVIGRSKVAGIAEEPLLALYSEILDQALHQQGSRLLVIGYGFRDRHINQVIADAVRTAALELFVVSPEPREDLVKRLEGGQAISLSTLGISKGIRGYDSRPLLRLLSDVGSEPCPWLGKLKAGFFAE